MKLQIFGLLFAVNLATGCVTTHSEGFVNYKEVGDVYGTKPQTVDYEEVGAMKEDASGFFWTSCDDICKKAVISLKDIAKERGGDSLIDVSFQGKIAHTKTPTCTTTWTWAWLGVTILGPWVKTCDVEGVAVARVGAKTLQNQALKKQAEPVIPTKLNSKNTQNGDAPTPD